MEASEIKAIAESVDAIGKKMDEKLAVLSKSVGDLEMRAQMTAKAPGVSEDMKSMIDHITGKAEVKVGTVANPTTGGYFAVPEFSANVVRKMYDENPLLPEITTYTVSGNVSVIPVETGAPDTHWVGEIETRTGDVGKLGIINIPMNEVTAKCPLSNVLIQDSNLINAEAYMTQRATEALARAVGAAIVNGTGHNQPEGLLNASGVSLVASGNASKITVDSLFDMMGALPSQAVPGAKWVMNNKTFWDIAGEFGSESNYVTMPLAEGIKPAILGRPVIIAEGMPDVASNAFPVMLGDLKEAYRGIQHEGVSYLSDPYTARGNGQTITWFSHRFGGQVVQPDALVKMKVAASI